MPPALSSTPSTPMQHLSLGHLPSSPSQPLPQHLAARVYPSIHLYAQLLEASSLMPCFYVPPAVPKSSEATACLHFFQLQDLNEDKSLSPS